MWLYKNAELTEVPEGFVGFVYMITNLTNGRRYIGKKNFYASRSSRRKGSTRRKRTKVVSDWLNYFGSSDLLLADVESLGRNNFKREVLHLCKTKGEMALVEITEQIVRNAVLSDDYYNSFIGCRIHGKHLKDFHFDISNYLP